MFENDARKVEYCRKCVTPSTRPRIVFDKKKVCNACRYMQMKEGIDWQARRNEFIEEIDRYRSSDGSWDCIVPWSGGKDSSTIAYKLKYEFGMNPLLVTNSPMMPNDVGVQNREALIRIGFDHVLVRPNQMVQRRLAKRFFIERGNPKVAWEAGKEAVPLRVAVKYKIPLIFYAEHGESEYGGKILHGDSSKVKDFTEVIENIVGDDPVNWVDDKISEKDLNPYIYPDSEEIREAECKVFYFAYFFRWSVYENYLYIKDKIDFSICPFGRTIGTFTEYDSLDDKMDDLYYYMQFIKFGFGRCIRDVSRHIQNGHMSREEGIELARRYDGEFPDRWFDEVLDYLDLDEGEFHEIVDKHRNPEVWKKEGGKWLLRYPPI